MTARGASMTSSVIADDVRFQDTAKLISTADMRRIADRQLLGRQRTGTFTVRTSPQSGHQHGADASVCTLIRANLFAILLFASC